MLIELFKLRCEVFMWGAFACSQAWFASGKDAYGYLFVALAWAAWLAGKLVKGSK